MFLLVIKRFAKGFIAGGFASVAILLSSGIVVTTVSDAKRVAFSLAMAFITGGLLAIDKAINYTPEPPAPIL